MSQREPTFLVFVITLVLSLISFIGVRCSGRPQFPNHRSSILVDISNEKTPSSVERSTLRSAAKQRRMVLLDSLIAQMSNSSEPPTIDWEKIGLRRNPSLSFRDMTPHRYSTARNSNGNGNGNDNDKRRPILENMRTSAHSNHQLVQADTPQELDDSNKKGKKNFSPEAELGLLNVYTLGDQLRKALSETENTNVTITCIGRTAEYNEIILLRATAINDNYDKSFRTSDNKYADDIPQKKIVFIVHGLSVMGFKEIPCLVVMKKFLLLLKNYFEHLDKFDIYLVPMANPDGVAHSYHFPLWNKNVSPQDACPGVALDRNFDIAWQTTSAVKSCNQQYPGDHPFSEPETQAIRDVLHRHSHKIIAYIHVHGGGYHEHIYKGDAILYPKGYSEAPGDDDKYVDMKGEIDEVMKNASFKSVSVTTDTLYNWYGKVSGASVDYASTVYGIPYALELVMQLYEVDPFAENSNETLAAAAQEEIWHRLINAILRYIFKAGVKHLEHGLVKKY